VTSLVGTLASANTSGRPCRGALLVLARPGGRIGVSTQAGPAPMPSPCSEYRSAHEHMKEADIVAELGRRQALVAGRVHETHGRLIDAPGPITLRQDYGEG